MPGTKTPPRARGLPGRVVVVLFANIPLASRHLQKQKKNRKRRKVPGIFFLSFDGPTTAARETGTDVGSAVWDTLIYNWRCDSAATFNNSRSAQLSCKLSTTTTSKRNRRRPSDDRIAIASHSLIESCSGQTLRHYRCFRGCWRAWGSLGQRHRRLQKDGWRGGPLRRGAFPLGMLL